MKTKNNKAAKAGWTVKPITSVKAALQAQDTLRVERFSDELEARRLTVLLIDEFIASVLARPAIKSLEKPGAAVVRVLMAEKGMSSFTATRVWNAFKLVGFANV